MNYRRAAFFCILLIPSLLTSPLMGDVTLHYKVETKLSSSLPAAVTQMVAPLRAAIAPAERTIAVKGGKLYTALGPIVMIADIANNQITLLDPATHHFATIAASDYANEIARGMPQLPASVKAIMSSMKMTADSKVTGRTAEIQGMQAAEREVTLSLNLAMPGAPAASPSSPPSSPMMKVVLQIWLAQPDEVARNPALREFIASGSQSIGGLNPADEIRKMTSLLPGIGDGLSSFLKELADAHSVALRTHAAVYMPILALLAARPAAGTAGNPLGDFDPNTPLVEMTQDLAEISTAPIADSMFAIPEGYTAAPVADIISAMSPKVTPPAAPASQPGFVQPSVLTRTLPGYTAEARAKKIEGAVILSALVGPDGKAQDIQIVQSLDPDLDQKAIEAVGQWTFRPGTRDGVPVKVRAQVAVNFRLLELPVAPPQ